MCICLYVCWRKEESSRATNTRKTFIEKQWKIGKFTLGGRGSLLSSTGSLLGAAAFAVAAGFFFAAAAGLAVVDGAGLAGSSSLSAAASGLAAVAPAGFFVIVAEFTGFAATGAAVVTAAVERGSPRRLSKTAFSAYSLICKKNYSL